MILDFCKAVKETIDCMAWHVVLPLACTDFKEWY